MILIKPEKGFALIEMTGAVTLADVKKKIGELLDHPDHRAGMDEIWDFRGATVDSLFADDLRSLAVFVKDRLDQVAKRTALVVSRDVDYGISRMWQIYASEKAPQERRLFRDIREAYQWFGGSPKQP